MKQIFRSAMEEIFKEPRFFVFGSGHGVDCGGDGGEFICMWLDVLVMWWFVPVFRTGKLALRAIVALSRSAVN